MINTVEKKYNLEKTFNSYKVTYTDNSNIRIVPLDEANTDYKKIQQWISEGNTVIDNGN
jgi:hypothetical protein